MYYKFFLVKRRPLKHHHNDFYSQIPQIYIFTTNTITARRKGDPQYMLKEKQQLNPQLPPARLRAYPPFIAAQRH